MIRPVCASLTVFLLVGSLAAHGQAIRIGRFDFVTVAGLDLVYSTNVEQEQEDEVTIIDGEEQEKEDYYLVARLSLSSVKSFSPNSTLSFNTGISVEEHFVRDDLDTLSEPFGVIDLEYSSFFGRYQTTFRAGYTRTETTEDDTFVPGGRKLRDVNTVMRLGADLAYEYGRFTGLASYSYSEERHEQEEFQDGDKDEQDFSVNLDYAINDRLSAVYEFDREKTDLLRSDDQFEGWEDRQFVGFEVLLIEDPNFLYTVGFEEEDDQEEEGEWELIHTFTIDETYDFTDTVTLTLAASYTIEDDREEDDTAFVYSARLDHTLDRYAEQSFTFTREPRDTFGATQDTDSTSYDWQLTKDQLFVRNLSLTLRASYDIDQPVASEEERTNRYGVTLDHERQLSRKLSRTLQYLYDYEDSNLTTPIREHRVQLSFDYTF